MSVPKRQFTKRLYQKRKHQPATLTTGNILLDPLIALKAVRGGAVENGGPIRDFVIVYANHAASRVAHLPIDKMIGQSLLKSMPGHLHTRLFEKYCQVYETGQSLLLDGFVYEDIFYGQRKQFILDIRATKQEPGLILTWRDVTQARLLEADLVEVKTHLVQSIETERKKLAAVLHDGPVQDLYAIDYQLHRLAQSLHSEDKLTEMAAMMHMVGQQNIAEHYHILTEIQEQLHGVIDTLMGTVGELRPTTLTPFGLKTAIMAHLDRLSEAHPQIQITLDLDDDGQRLATLVRLGLYRIYQQAVDNILKHTCATQIWVGLKLEARQVILTVEDNGCGFETPERWVTLAREGRLGLARASDQAQRLGGQLEIQSQPGRGTRVCVILPIQAQVG